jgi:hypothetical protein
MAKTSTATEVGQEGSLREGLEAAIRERVADLRSRRDFLHHLHGHIQSQKNLAGRRGLLRLMNIDNQTEEDRAY